MFTLMPIPTTIKSTPPLVRSAHLRQYAADLFASDLNVIRPFECYSSGAILGQEIGNGNTRHKRDLRGISGSMAGLRAMEA